MTITSHIAAAGLEGVSRFPALKRPLDECELPGGKGYSRAALMDALSTARPDAPELVNVGSEDRDAVLVVGAELIEMIHKYISQIIAKVGGEVKEENRECLAKLRGADRAMRKGAVSYVRIYLTGDTANGAVKIRVTYSNPRNVPGESERFAHDIARMYVQAALYLSEDWAANGCKVRINVVDHAQRPGLVAEAIEDRARRELAGKRKTCPHRVAGDFCEGCHRECELFVADGMKCREVEL